MLSNKEAKESLLKGINLVADAVKVTAGAEGKTALIETVVNFPPHATKDGVTIARNCYGDTEYVQLGCDLIKEALNKTVEEEADGTTTTAILTQSLIQLGYQSGKSHVVLRKEMQDGFNIVERYLDENCKMISTLNEKVEIATVSANNDKELGELIATVYDRVGLQSTVKVEEGSTKKTEVEYTEGIQLNTGMIFPHFATDFQKGICEFKSPNILIYSGNIKTVVDIKEQVEECVFNNKPLLLICNDIENAVVGELFDLKKSGRLQVCIINSPEWGEKRINILEDISAVTGASIYEPDFSEDIVFGTISKVLITNKKTVLIPSEEDSILVGERVSYLKEQEERGEDVNERISNLTSAVVTITVGGENDIDIKERKDRVDDAVGALRSALKGGYVPGGGSALYYIGQENKNNIVFEAIKEPMKQILKNADINLEKNSLKFFGQGVNVLEGVICNMYEQGIIDSKNVQITALRNAINIANTFFQTEILIKSNLYYGK